MGEKEHASVEASQYLALAMAQNKARKNPSSRPLSAAASTTAMCSLPNSVSQPVLPSYSGSSGTCLSNDGLQHTLPPCPGSSVVNDTQLSKEDPTRIASTVHAIQPSHPLGTEEATSTDHSKAERREPSSDPRVRSSSSAQAVASHSNSPPANNSGDRRETEWRQQVLRSSKKPSTISSNKGKPTPFEIDTDGHQTTQEQVDGLSSDKPWSPLMDPSARQALQSQLDPGPSQGLDRSDSLLNFSLITTVASSSGPFTNQFSDSQLGDFNGTQKGLELPPVSK